MDRRCRLSSAVLAVLLGFALVASCRPSQTVGRQTDDASIKTSIKAKLATDVGAKTITSVEGVVSVTNNIQLSGEAVPPPQPATTSGPVMTPPPPGSTLPPAATPY